MNKKTLIFSFIVAIVVFLAYQEARKGGDSTLVENEILPFSSISIDKLKLIQLSMNNVVLKKQDGAWLVEDGVGTRVDRVKLEEFVSALQEIKAFPSTLTPTQLALPTEPLGLSLEQEGVDSIDLLVSENQTYDGKFHVLNTETQAIFVVNPEVRQLFEKSANSFRDLRIFMREDFNSIEKVDFVDKSGQFSFSKKDGAWYWKEQKLEQNKFLNILRGVISFEAELVDETLSKKATDLSNDWSLKILGQGPETTDSFELLVKINGNRVLLQQKDEKLVYVTAIDLIKEWLFTEKTIPLESAKEEAK